MVEFQLSDQNISETISRKRAITIAQQYVRVTVLKVGHEICFPIGIEVAGSQEIESVATA